ncbi:peroxisome biogenesis factor 10 [Ischnura elegans]|uniref:peroxisome biogenesis factor 10 n=1 Tax=Ischnura elegans TaxID=197161 RepID=UPI001ED883E1|nr:peroxisome biogenesis factor 10 [Ischnura elegans]
MAYSKFKAAGQAEILRAAQKDENYIQQLNEVISNVALNFGGKSFWLKYARYHIILSKTVYYASTSLCNLQTLGEEYTGIIPMQRSLRTLLTLRRMLLYVIMLSGGHIALERMFAQLEKATLPGSMQMYSIIYHDAVRMVKHLMPYLERLNKSIFYWNGSYYSLVNRFLGVKHALVQSWLKDEASLYGFKILAGVTFANLIVSFIHTFPSQLASKPSVSLPEVTVARKHALSRNTCKLCLGGRKNTSITPCGHLFCWTCIMKWLQIRKDCPMCKSNLIPSRITFLMNYDRYA